jgi:hypothetical protein
MLAPAKERVKAVFVLLLPVLLGACSKLSIGLDPPPEPPFEVRFHASDGDRALKGVNVLSGTKVIGATDATGIVTAKFRGQEGDMREVTIQCPAEFESPAKPIAVSLRRFAPGSPPPLFEVRCAPSLRTVVVGIRAENGANLPILYLTRPVARTDRSGAALFVLRVKPDEQVQLTISTTDGSGDELRPQSPTLTFLTKNRDDFVLLDQPFLIQKKPVVFRKKPPPDNRPQRI